MTLFPNTPHLTPAHRKRIAPHLGNVRTTLRPWLATNPSTDDLKRAVQIEVEQARDHYEPLRAAHRGVLDLLLRQIQRNERGEIDTRILKELKP